MTYPPQAVSTSELLNTVPTLLSPGPEKYSPAGDLFPIGTTTFQTVPMADFTQQRFPSLYSVNDLEVIMASGVHSL